ncbi:NDR1/HIN1-like protein 10 [Magnolia sinica]|uniref:NDR1/HIN1-like protein 10 n=1 Tax=Magnolia sinica TaxID=86752 RepID=UPI002657B192|nr:NDR1/HIN1-like protein 10 [Magnolia sinica]
MANDHQHKPVTGYPAAQSSYPPHISGTAYPYPAPPPAPYYPTNPYPPPPPQYDPRRALFLRRLIAAAIAVFIIIGAIIFIFWLVLRPRLPEFTVRSVSVSRFNISSSQLTANWDISLSALNTNTKMAIYYDRVEASVFYGSDLLSETTLAPFYQGKRNLTTVRATLAAVSEYVRDGVVRDLSEDRARRGSVNFHVKLLAWVRFRSGAWRTRRHLLRVFCEDVRVGLPSAARVGTLVGQPRECEVDL